MRRALAVGLIAVASLFVIGATGCGEAAPAGLAGGDNSPQALVAATISASETMTAATGSFEVSLSFDVDTSEMPAEAMPLLNEPMTLSGTFAYADEPQAGDCTISLSAGGEVLDVGVKMVDDKFWLSLLDQWYEAPEEMVEMMGDSFGQQAKLSELKSLLNELGIDPVTWFKDLRLVGEETIAGTDVYHLSGSPDTTKIMTDLLALMNSEEFMSLVDPSNSMTDTMGVEDLLPSMEDIQEIQGQLNQMLRDFTIDLWVGKKDSLLRKVAVELNMVPPADEEVDGLNGIALKALLKLDDPGKVVKVVAPPSARPFSELEKAIEDNPEMFMGPFMGILGGFGGFGDMDDLSF